LSKSKVQPAPTPVAATPSRRFHPALLLLFADLRILFLIGIIIVLLVIARIALGLILGFGLSHSLGCLGNGGGKTKQ